MKYLIFFLILASCTPEPIIQNCNCYQQTATFYDAGDDTSFYETERISMPNYRCEASDPNTWYPINGTVDFVYRFVILCE